MPGVSICRKSSGVEAGCILDGGVARSIVIKMDGAATIFGIARRNLICTTQGRWDIDAVNSFVRHCAEKRC